MRNLNISTKQHLNIISQHLNKTTSQHHISTPQHLNISTSQHGTIYNNSSRRTPRSAFRL
ncbi:MAG: hypothetical protein MR490_01230 [Prevotella sp.]|nr:hypothetical protein [Prevotella sp.]